MSWLILAMLLAAPPAEDSPFWQRFREVIHRHLGRPYVWGACGLKSFDCSGFVWRVMADNGILIKRTTARKLYMALPLASKTDAFRFGNIVFFDNLKHCGIVNGKDSFYHAESTRGTTLSPLGPYWRGKVYGVRRLRLPE